MPNVAFVVPASVTCYEVLHLLFLPTEKESKTNYSIADREGRTYDWKSI